MRALFVVALLAPTVAAASPADTLAEVQASYKGVKGMTGSFTQTVTRNTYGTTSKSRGSLYLARPDKMRWDYIDAKAKPDKSMIFDGKTLWVVEPKNLQVIQHEATATSLPAAVAFLNGGDLTKDFTVTQPATNTLELVPKATTAKVKTLTFVIDPQTKQVVKSIVLDHNGDTNTFELVLGAKQPDAKIFEFSPKRVPTYKVIKV
jgi:chaperone LolA